MNRQLTKICALLALTLAGCSGGGGGGGSSNSPPAAAFTATPLAGSAPLTVQLDASASSASGTTIASYRWDFGDGSAVASGLSLGHLYPLPGTFGVTLTITDGHGAVATTTQQITIPYALVPDVAGLTLADATASITGLTLAVGIVHLSGVVFGPVPAAQPRVVSQARAPGVALSPGMEVGLVLTTDPGGGAAPIQLSQAVRHFQGGLPWHGARVGDRFSFTVGVASTYELVSGTASVGGRDTALVYYHEPPSPCDYDKCFSANLDLAGLPSGPLRVTARVVDVLGNFTDVTITVIHDPLPGLTIVAPLNDSAALPTLPVDVTCTDDQPGCRVEVLGPAVAGSLEHLADGVGGVVATLDLARFAGGPLDLLFRVFDSTGQLTEIHRNIYVETAGRLTSLVTVPGKIIDTDATRLLYFETPEAGDRISIYSRATLATEQIPLPDGYRIDDRSARLTPAGAMFVAAPIGSTGLNNQIFLWRNGSLTNLVNVGGHSLDVHVAGVHASFAVREQNVDSVYRLDTTTGISSLVSTDTLEGDSAVAADGTIVVSNASGLIRDRPGAQIVLAADATVRRFGPKTDGGSVVYEHVTPGPQTQRAIALIVDTAAPAFLTTLSSSSSFNYEIAGGWVAYRDLGLQQQLHIFRRDPQGAVVRVTDFSGSSTLDRLAENGDVMLFNGSKRYLSRGATLTPLSGSYGKGYWLGGAWYIAMGATLVAVDTSAL